MKRPFQQHLICGDPLRNSNLYGCLNFIDRRQSISYWAVRKGLETKRSMVYEVAVNGLFSQYLPTHYADGRSTSCNTGLFWCDNQ